MKAPKLDIEMMKTEEGRAAARRYVEKYEQRLLSLLHEMDADGIPSVVVAQIGDASEEKGETVTQIILHAKPKLGGATDEMLLATAMVSECEGDMDEVKRIRRFVDVRNILRTFDECMTGVKSGTLTREQAQEKFDAAANSIPMESLLAAMAFMQHRAEKQNGGAPDADLMASMRQAASSTKH